MSLEDYQVKAMIKKAIMDERKRIAKIFRKSEAKHLALDMFDWDLTLEALASAIEAEDQK